MKTLLIYPPLGDYTIPPLGVATLLGFVKKYDYEVKILDYNIDSLYFFLSEDYMEQCKIKVNRRLTEIENEYDELDKKIYEEYKSLFLSSLQSDYLINNIARSFAKLKEPVSYECWEIYSEYASIIAQSMMLVANAHYPSKWDFRYFSFRDDSDPTTIKNLLTNKSENFLIDYFEEKTNEIIKNDAKYIGISVCYYSQLIPALTLANIIKENTQGKKVFLGGSLFNAYMNQWDLFNEFSDIIDFIIPFAGEWPVLDIIEGHSLEGIANIVIQKNNEFVMNDIEEHRLEPFRVLPDYNAFDLGKYLMPDIILPISANSGCYWGQCRFCYHSTRDISMNKEHIQSKEAIIGEIKYMMKTYNAKGFFFVDDCLLPKLAIGIADSIVKEGIKIKWFSELRFDSRFTKEKLYRLRKSGFSMAMFGLESSNDRMLKMMKKGTSLSIIKRILVDCLECDISTYIMFFLGFPSETKVEALETINFIDLYMEYINYYTFGAFVLQRNIDVYRNPEEYGIKIFLGKNDLSLAYNYKSNSGMSKEEANALVEKLRNERQEFLRYEMISATHICYLPKINSSARRREEKKISFNHKQIWKRKETIVCRKTQYPILNEEDQKGGYFYLYDLKSRDLYSVGKSIWDFYRCFDGEKSIEEIVICNKKNMDIKAILNVLLENKLIFLMEQE